jgi:hypothetical protein
MSCCACIYAYMYTCITHISQAKQIVQTVDPCNNNCTFNVYTDGSLALDFNTVEDGSCDLSGCVHLDLSSLGIRSIEPHAFAYFPSLQSM